MTEQDYIDIEMWLQGELPAGRLAEFKTRRSTDPRFDAAINEREELFAHLRATEGEPKFRATLRDVVADKPHEAKVVKMDTTRPRRVWLTMLSAAATVLLLILAFQFFTQGDDFADSPFGDHPPLALVERGGTTNLAQDAEARFNAREYAAAISPLRELISQASTPQIRLALGISLMETSKDDEAEQIFTELAAENSALVGYANWYLALISAKNGDDAAARRYLDLLPEEDDYLMNKARRLRERL